MWLTDESPLLSILYSFLSSFSTISWAFYSVEILRYRWIDHLNKPFVLILMIIHLSLLKNTVGKVRAVCVLVILFGCFHYVLCFSNKCFLLFVELLVLICVMFVVTNYDTMTSKIVFFPISKEKVRRSYRRKKQASKLAWYGTNPKFQTQTFTHVLALVSKVLVL